MRPLITLLLVLAAGCASPLPAAEAEKLREVSELKITILSTMLAERGIGEWGFAALVEADGRRILFDTGGRPETVLQNAGELGVDLKNVTDVVLSHNHGDHTAGLLTLREKLRGGNPAAISRAHVAPGLFWKRPEPERTRIDSLRKDYEALGGEFVEHAGAAEVLPGVWLTGPVPRTHPEKNYPAHPSFVVETPDGTRPDTIPESMSLVVNTAKGLVLVSGCGHAGLINTLEHARKITRPAPIHAAIGGFHLMMANDEHLAWTAGKLSELGLENFVGAHCTGLEPVYRFRELTELDRPHSVVGAIGSSFTLKEGIAAGMLAR